jgi:hypothetical protein
MLQLPFCHGTLIPSCSLASARWSHSGRCRCGIPCAFGYDCEAVGFELLVFVLIYRTIVPEAVGGRPWLTLMVGSYFDKSPSRPEPKPVPSPRTIRLCVDDSSAVLLRRSRGGCEYRRLVFVGPSPGPLSTDGREEAWNRGGANDANSVPAAVIFLLHFLLHKFFRASAQLRWLCLVSVALFLRRTCRCICTPQCWWTRGMEEMAAAATPPPRWWLFRFTTLRTRATKNHPLPAGWCRNLIALIIPVLLTGRSGRSKMISCSCS